MVRQGRAAAARALRFDLAQTSARRRLDFAPADDVNVGAEDARKARSSCAASAFSRETD